MFTRAVRQRVTVGTDVPVLGFLALGDGPFDAFQPLGAALLQPLVGFPRLFSAFLVDVVRRVGCFPVCLPPGGDALVHGVRMAFAAALGQVWLSVEHVDGVVVGGVLLGRVVANGLAVGRVVAQGDFQTADHRDAIIVLIWSCLGLNASEQSVVLLV